jgi:hypothetical protein
MPKARRVVTKSRKKVYPMIGVMKSSSRKYSMVTSITGEGIAIRVNGHKINLDMAPKDENGVVKVLDLRDDDIVWTSGVRYFDPATGEYFPKTSLRCDEILKIAAGKEEEHEEGEEVEEEKEEVVVDSIGTVGTGCVVNIF